MIISIIVIFGTVGNIEIRNIEGWLRTTQWLADFFSDYDYGYYGNMVTTLEVWRLA